MKKTLVIVLLLIGFLCAYATAYANNDIYEFTGTNTMYEYRNINVTKGETIYLVTDGFTTYSIDGKDFVYPAQTVVDSVSVYTRRGDPVEFDTNRYGKDMAVIELITYSYTTKEKNE